MGVVPFDIPAGPLYKGAIPIPDIGNYMWSSGHGPKFSVLATNRLNDEFDASPVIVGDEIYLRGHKNLYCIAQ